MKIASEKDVEHLIRNDEWMMSVLSAAEELDLPDWWIGAGFLRNRIWDEIGERPSKPSRDVDLVYFNPVDVAPEIDWAYDEKMHQKYPFAEWEVRNQARMHYKSGLPFFTSTEDGISNWVETATCIGVKKQVGELAFLWCYGIDDVLGLIARPIAAYKTSERLPVFYSRVKEKRWQERWPTLRIEVD